MRFLDRYPEVKKFYEKVGFAGKVGFGSRPAVLVIDMAHGWCDIKSTMGADFSECIHSIKEILCVARQVKSNVPIIFTTTGYQGDFPEISETMRHKMPVLSQQLIGSRWVELIPDLERRPKEAFLIKKHPSCFSGTNILELLISENIDTLIVTGCTISGCVHATCLDAACLGYHVIVPHGAVGDRDSSMVTPFLLAIDARYGDVVEVDDVTKYLKQIG